MTRFLISIVFLAALTSGCATAYRCTPEERADLNRENQRLSLVREDLVTRGVRAKDHGQFDGNEVAHASEVRRYNIWAEQLRQDAERFNQQCAKARE